MVVGVAAAPLSPVPAFVGVPDPVTTRVSETIISGVTTSGLVTNRDSIYWQTNVASGGVLPIYSVSPPPLDYTNRTPLVASFDGSTLTFLQNGTATILARYGVYEKSVTKPVVLSAFSATAAGTNYVFVTNVVGSLAHHVATNTFGRMTGDATTKRALFTVRTVATTNYTRNTGFFLADVNGIESYPAGNSGPYDYMNGCLVSPRHMLSVYHIGSQLGQTVWFVNRTNNAVLARVVIDYVRVNLSSDQTVALLGEPLPSSIVPAAIVTNHYSFLPQYSSLTGAALFVCRVPVIAFNQSQSPGINYLNTMAGEAFGTTPSTAFGDWSRTLYPGDSGSPCGMVVSNRLCIVGNWTGAGSGNCAFTLKSDIQAAMNVLCARNGFTNETVATLPLGGFTTY